MPLRYLALAAALLACPGAFAQQPAAYSPPRTADGHPDLQGVWGALFLTPFERPKEIKELNLPEDQARTLAAKWSKETPDLIDPDFFLQNVNELASVKGAFRSSIIVKPDDGQMPFTEKGAKVAEHSGEREEFSFDNPEERPTYERCIAGQGQAPIRQIPALIPNLIVQTPQSIALVTEDVGSLRIIHMDGRKPPPDVVRTYEGWSSGRWDGDTLVIVTTHTRADDLIRGQFGRPVLVGPGSKVTERFTRLSASELHYEFTVEDPDLYTAPWLAEYVFKLADTPWYEYACHEANYSIVNALLAARVGRQSKPKPKK